MKQGKHNMEGIDIFCASDLTAGGRICPECWYSQALNQHAIRNLSVGVICLFACSFLFPCICPILNKCVCVCYLVCYLTVCVLCALMQIAGRDAFYCDAERRWMRLDGLTQAP